VSGLDVNSRYIYWSNETAGNIGRARLNGPGVTQKFITGAAVPQDELTIDSRYIYWANTGTGTIGRANLDGTDVNEKFITVPTGSSPSGSAVWPWTPAGSGQGCQGSRRTQHGRGLPGLLARAGGDAAIARHDGGDCAGRECRHDQHSRSMVRPRSRGTSGHDGRT
jgi:hypothetical protein